MLTQPETVSPVTRQAAPSQTGQGVVLHGVSWAAYEQLLADLHDSHAAHLAYDRGALEIMVLSAEHEEYKDVIALLINVLAEEMGIDVRSFGSTTFRRQDLQRGFEPDACFYIQDEARVRGKKKLDLTVDPPPDLVVEVDIASPSLDKFPIYAHIGVPEVWRYDGHTLSVFTLENGEYRERTQSAMLPGLPSRELSQLINDSHSLKRTVWLRRVREWVRQRGD